MTKLWSNRAQATISCFGLRRSFRDGDLCRSLAHRSDGQFQKIAFGLATVALLLPIPHRLYRELLALCEICRSISLTALSLPMRTRPSWLATGGKTRWGVRTVRP